MGKYKRSLVVDEEHPENGPEMQSRKTTLHLANQERAYVAASRRADRSLEARHQSALMASHVHRKRTGKTLRITHQIVRDEEMYEEEDDPQTLSGGGGQPQRLQHPAEYRGRKLSQTDTYIAALIARKAGVPSYLGIPSTLYASAAPANGAWPESLSSATAYNSGSAPTTMHQPIGYDGASDGVRCPADSQINSQFAPNLEGEQELSFDSCFAEPASYPGIISPVSASSNGSSVSDDTSSYESNYIFGSGSQEHSLSPGASSLWLNDLLAKADGEGELYLAQNGVSLG